MGGPDGGPVTYRVLLRLRTRPGLGRQFERVWRAGADAISHHPDQRGQWLARDAAVPDTYWVTSDWAGEAAFRDYERSSAHAAHLARLRPYRADGDMTAMTVLCDLPARVAAAAGGVP